MSSPYAPLLGDVNEREKDSGKMMKSVRKSQAIPLVMSSSAPIATSEIDEDSANDDREVVSDPYPGVDDGFFDNNKNNKLPPDVEKFDPATPPRIPDIDVTPGTPDTFPPNLAPRLGPDEEVDDANGKPDENDGTTRPDTRGFNPNSNNKPPFLTPSWPGYDMEGGSFAGDLDQSIPDVNIYQHKKTLAQGMMDLALFSANANQLRYVVESYERHPYYYPSIIFIAISLLLQIGVGIGLIWNATYNVKDQKEICIANRINNFTVIGIFLITVINVFISAFGVATIQSIPPT